MNVPSTCPACRRWYDPGLEPDPCLGRLPGVIGACCGHGKPADAHIEFETGVILRGFTVQKGTGVYRPPVPKGE